VLLAVQGQDNSRYRRLIWQISDCPGKVVVEPVDFKKFNDLLSSNTIRIVISPAPGESQSKIDPSCAAAAAATDIDTISAEKMKEMEQDPSYRRTDDDDEENFPEDLAAKDKSDKDVYPGWWPGGSKKRPEVVLVLNPSIPSGQQLLIKRHFSEAIGPLHGNTLMISVLEHRGWFISLLIMNRKI